MQLVGHVPYKLVPIISLFLKRDVNKALVGEKVNRGAGYGLEIPWSSVKCQLSDYVFLRRVPRRTIIAKTSNLHQKVGYRQDYK